MAILSIFATYLIIFILDKLMISFNSMTLLKYMIIILIAFIIEFLIPLLIEMRTHHDKT